jgi:hypothetical protein
MQTYPKKQIIFLTIGLIVHTLLFMIVGYLVNKFPSDMSYISVQDLSICEVVFALLSLYTLTRAWVLCQRILKRRAARLPGTEISGRQLTSFLLLFVYVPLIAPCIYGLVLMFLGMPLTYFYFFTGSSIAAGLVWAGYNLSRVS